MAATVAMSAAKPPAPLGSFALKHITQAGMADSWADSVGDSLAGDSSDMKKCPIREVFGLRKTLADESKNVRYVALQFLAEYIKYLKYIEIFSRS